MKTEMQEKWLNNEEAASFLNVSTKTLKKYRDSGRLPYYKDLRKIMFKQSDLEAYLIRFYNPIE